MPAYLRNIAMMLVCALALVSCSGSDEPDTDYDGIPPYAVYDIVTVKSTGPKGSVFGFRVDGDSPLIEYTANIDFNKSDKINPGTRLLICYNRIDGATYTSGSIKLYGYSLLSNTNQDPVAQPVDTATLLPLKITALWRSGMYINLQASIYVYKAIRPKTLELVYDESTLADPYPTLYVSYANADNNDGQNLYEVQASFDIAGIWNQPTCKGVDICCASPSGLQHTIIEKK